MPQGTWYANLHQDRTLGRVGVDVHVWLGYALLGVQALLLVPVITHTIRARAADGMSLLGETIWTAAGAGWVAYALMIGSPTIVASGFLALVGSGTLSILLWPYTTKKQHHRAVTVTTLAASAGATMGLLWSTEGLSIALSVFGVVQFIPHLWSTTRVLRYRSSSAGVSVTGSTLRAVYTGGWAVYAAGWAIWGSLAGPIQWPLLIWGVAGAVAFATQAFAAALGRRNNWQSAPAAYIPVMNDILRKKNTGEPTTNGGEFGGKSNSAPEAHIVASRPTHTIRVANVPAIKDYSAAPLPFPLPHLGTPGLDYDTDDVTGHAFVSVELGDFNTIVTKDPYEGWQLDEMAYSDFVLRSEKPESRAEFEQFENWVKQVASRIDYSDQSYVNAIRSDTKLRAGVVAAALGEPVPTFDQRAIEDARALEIVVENYGSLDELQEAIDDNHIDAEGIMAMLRAAQR